MVKQHNSKVGIQGNSFWLPFECFGGPSAILDGRLWLFMLQSKMAKPYSESQMLNNKNINFYSFCLIHSEKKGQIILDGVLGNNAQLVFSLLSQRQLQLPALLPPLQPHV